MELGRSHRQKLVKLLHSFTETESFDIHKSCRKYWTEDLDNVKWRGRTVEQGYLDRLPYSRATVEKNFRLHPVGSFLFHKSIKDTIEPLTSSSPAVPVGGICPAANLGMLLVLLNLAHIIRTCKARFDDVDVQESIGVRLRKPNPLTLQVSPSLVHEGVYCS
ncbi:protein MpCYP829J2 [Marchantia polymorpha subsp. ruderalis]|uniref:Uncharacterized protein n=2 Tax=Marchantia polymorpha TaxID=3197 RepID=A0AAF6B4Z2_MARPO|nr:hypothetical protein MARPO_0066s0065 [Marchantia polymorpha]BBN07076.1 hypothetical protein Mp_4g00770 [Marchantia polymorpha subsp. ruderalis]|eukprot:PTQ36108.1 hypothetical protein MARPO_0066s0065 [Marchantia polymorpha]